MSSTFVADTSDDHKTDNTLIIIVNNDGTISVDQETLQNILANQQNTAVSVVRVGGPSQGDDSSQDSSGTCDSQNDSSPHVNLTVEGFYPSSASSDAGTGVTSVATTTSSATPVSAVTSNVDMVPEMVAPSTAAGAIGAVPSVPTASSAEGESLDPFLEMDPEQLERLETALQSEQAKQILGENVTAMLDMLTVEEEATQLKDSILNDHCYTNRSPATAPAAPPAVAPVVTHQFTANSGREESGTILLHQSDHLQPILPAGMGSPVVQTIIRGRGRGRGGRPRRDGSSGRGSSVRGVARGGLGRGGIKVQRGGTIVSGTGTGNMIMVQQIKQITPPLSAGGVTPAVGASMVPLVRPLVIQSATSSSGQVTGGTVVRTTASGQKQIITVPQGARLITVQGKSSSGDSGGQQTVLLTSAGGQVVQTQQIQGVGSVSSQISNASNAKVVVAKMPPILPPHQFLGAQPNPLTEQPTQHLQKEDESDFTDFPQEISEESDSDESDVGSDDEYKDPTVGRRGGRGSIKGRGRFSRGNRSRGACRVYEGGRGSRGGRRGRGRNIARAEDMDRVKKLDAEMAGFVAAMEKSPERSNAHVEKIVPQDVRDKHIKKEEPHFSSDGSPEISKKKMLKVYGKSVKKTSEGSSEEVLVKTESVSVLDKIEKNSSPQSSSEKKFQVLKSPIKRHSPEIPSSGTVQPQSTQASPVTPTTPISPSTPIAPPAVTASDARKNYPKRENRKPPAHLAEALGPALFSTPDIIRRVSTGPDQKPLHESSVEEEKKEMKSHSGGPGVSLEMISEDKMCNAVSETPKKGLQNLPSDVMQDVVHQVVMDALQTSSVKTEDMLEQSSLVQDDLPKENLSLDIKPKIEIPEPAPTISEESEKPKQLVQQILSKTLPTKPQTALPLKRSSRRRSSSSSTKNEKKEGSKQNSGPMTKDKKRAEEIKQKGRRRLSEVDEDDEEDMPSSDDESWNSEDDPDRLWCICKKPHNNRFMICCDICEDWFHGKCVGVTKAMGKQMENKGIDWSCPNCAKKKEDEKELKKNALSNQKEKEIKKTKESKKDSVEKNTETMSAEVNETPVSSVVEGTSQQGRSDAEIMYCIVCKKEARPSSIYCGDACILKHAQESLNCISRDKAVAPGSSGGTGSRDANHESQLFQQPSTRETEGGQSSSSNSSAIPHQSIKTRPDARVMVFERKTGVILAGSNAPTAGNLKTWLKDNPTFEVFRPGLTPSHKFPASKVMGAKSIVVQSKGQKPIQQMKGSQAHSPTVSTALPTKHGINLTQKMNATTQKTLLLQQKSPAGSLKAVVPTQKVVTSVSSPIKVMPSKVHKGPIVVPAQPQKVLIKASPKQLNNSAKTNTKAPSVANAPKVPASPSSKVAPSNVSKALATSTVKETAKSQTEKPVAKKVEMKRQSSSSSVETVKKEEEKEKDKPSGPEPIRLNVRKTLQELLQARIQECSDLEVAELEVQNIAINIEEEMHSFFRDTGIKYKSKYRSLVFNIKDRKNLTLFRKIADKSLTPHQLVRLSPEELASQELAQWREREAKHQLEMIKKTELDLMSQAKTYVMKTHKGEQVIETDESLKVEVPELVDPATVPDLVSPVNNSVSSTVEDVELDKIKLKVKDKDSKDKPSKEEKEHSRDRERSKHDDKRRDKSEKSRSDKDRRDSHHDRHDKEKRRDSKEKDRSKSSSRDKHRNSEKSKRDSEKHRESKSSSSRKDKKEDDVKKEEHVKKESTLPEVYDGEAANESLNMFMKEESKDETEINTKLVSSIYSKTENQEDSDLSDREPSSTVTIKTPDINTEDHEKSVSTTVWKGFVNMPDVAKFFTTVQIVSGDPQNLCKDLPDTVDIVGRIAPKTVWEYISKMKKTGTKEILVIRLTAANDEEKIPYITLYTYLSTRGRLGVVGNVSSMIKDFYIMPLASHLPVPQILLPLVGPGFEEFRPHLLIGILVRARRKRLAPENEYVAKMPKRILPPPIPSEPLERSYTPPLPGSDADILGSLTPPHPPPSHSSGSYTPPSSPQAFLGGSGLAGRSTDPRLNRMDKDSLQDDFDTTDKSVTNNKQSLSSHSGQFTSGTSGGGGDDDDDAPYSPGGSDDDIESSEDNILSTPKNPVELQRKVEELNRKIEEQKQQIESISSAIVASDPSVAVLGTVSESMNVNSMMQNYILGSTSEEAAAPAPEDGDENEAYSPSRSFTPPSTSIPFIGPAESGSNPVFSKLTSNINLPSNLHEILATIKKQESDKAAGSKGINLKADPIVQNYGKSTDSETSQSKTTTDDFSAAESSVFTSAASSGVSSTPTTSASILQSASSALLSLSTPVVHPLASGASVVSTSVSTKVDSKVSRDPRQRVSDVVNKTSGSTLSSLSDDDLIKKALEMEMEMTEPKINTAVAVEKSVAVTIPTLPQPLPPGVDSMPTVSASVPPVKASIVSKSVPSGQPLPPGVEDEDYSSYSSFGVSNPSTVVPPINIPVQSYSMHSPNSQAPYRVPHPYPGASYNISPARVPPQTSGYSSTFPPPPPPPPPSGYPANVEDSSVPASNTKRKFSDSESDESTIKRDRCDSPPRGSREEWDSKMPVPVLGRFSGRGRGFTRGALSGQRGFVRLRGGASHPPGPPPPPPPPPSNRSRWESKDSDRKRSRYESGRSDWEAHNKDFDEKHRERSREGHHRDRSRERDKSSVSLRSHSTRSSRSRDSEKGSDSP